MEVVVHGCTREEEERSSRREVKFRPSSAKTITICSHRGLFSISPFYTTFIPFQGDIALPRMSLTHVYIVKQTDYKFPQYQEEVESESVIHGVHLTLESANNAAVAIAKDLSSEHGKEWDDVDKEFLTTSGGGHLIICNLMPDYDTETDHFHIAVEKHSIEEGIYPDEDADEDEEEDEEDEEPAEVAEPPAKRKRIEIDLTSSQ